MSYKGLVFASAALAAICAATAASADYYYSGYDHNSRTWASGYGSARPSFWGWPALDLSGGDTRVIATADEIEATREYNDWRYGPFYEAGYGGADRGVDDYGRNYFSPYALYDYRDYGWPDYGPRDDDYAHDGPAYGDGPRYAPAYYREREYSHWESYRGGRYGAGWESYRGGRYEGAWGEYRRPGYSYGWSYHRGASYDGASYGAGSSGWGD